MLEISKKKIVKTRKEHECYACLKAVSKDEEAICINAKEDEQRIRFHLHLDCNKVIAKRKIELQHGCLEGGNVLLVAGHWECKYCDLGFPTSYYGDVVCGSCTAEWEDAKIYVNKEQ